MSGDIPTPANDAGTPAAPTFEDMLSEAIEAATLVELETATFRRSLVLAAANYLVAPADAPECKMDPATIMSLFIRGEVRNGALLLILRNFTTRQVALEREVLALRARLAKRKAR